MRSQLDEDKGEENDQQEQQERNKNYKLLCKSVWNRIGVWQQVLPDGLSIRRQKVTTTTDADTPFVSTTTDRT